MQKLLPPLPYFFIGKAQATARIGQFIAGKHKTLSAELGRPDTKHVWYSREHLITLLEEMDFLGASGLRIYFGEYEAKHSLAPGQTCLIMVPTRTNAKLKGEEDIITEDEPGFDERQQMPKSEPGWRLNGDIIAASLPKEYNYGSPCPPVCNDGEPNGDGGDGLRKFPQ